MITSENNITTFALGMKPVVIPCVVGDIVFHTVERMFCGNTSCACQVHPVLVGILGQWIMDGVFSLQGARLYHMGLVL